MQQRVRQINWNSKTCKFDILTIVFTFGKDCVSIKMNYLINNVLWLPSKKNFKNHLLACELSHFNIYKKNWFYVLFFSKSISNDSSHIKH